ncbi:M17 family metallopeptidase [Cognatishimia sp. MH4019]|uniref:leucyl aminopeptidase family protein n=1 Tax=Cognatishimia sp. MH4019 TaxID=2854030 RepID=UPI001CD4D8DD|nr:leucyl aminopeptidase family protein [Cognatishimia sp. MH4019]
MSLTFADPDTGSLPIHLLTPDSVGDWAEAATARARNWIDAQGFAGRFGKTLMLPDENGAPEAVLLGLGTAQDRARKRFALAAGAAGLPAGTYHIESGLDEIDAEVEALGWLLSQYRFDRYADQPLAAALLKAPAGVDAARVEAIAAGEALTRDLINTPTSDMGPDALEAAARSLSEAHGAAIEVTIGDALLEQNFPMIHTVGRASATAPRLIDMRWGEDGPTLTLVGKGVCFDTGGLNIKPGSSMGLMKKDMGGSATVLGLASMIMTLKLPVQLRVLIPAVENSIDGSAFRPQDILTSRKGLTVEINNTDAEGRLVLADALALADEETPDCLISMATLTGAARVAVGPDLAPYFSDDAGFVAALEEGAVQAQDPVWRLPFHAPYESMIEPGIADLDNAPKGGFAGSITAALFLRRFVTDSPRYAHFDIYGWQPTAAPARAKGGIGQGARAVLDALPKLLNL